MNRGARDVWSAALASVFLAGVFLAGMFLAGVAQAQSSVSPKHAHGKIEGEVRWSGRVFVDGDIEIVDGAVLFVLPGTDIRIADSDITNSGFNRRKVEFHVFGQIRVQGTVEKPVIFRPAGKVRDFASSWHGLVMRPVDALGQRSKFSCAYFNGAFAAIQVPKGSVVIEDCVFRDCAVGVEVGSAYRDDTRTGLRPRQLGVSTPEIRRCRFTLCNTGVFCEGKASPDVQNSVFYRCGTAVGNQRPGYAASLQDPGPVVERCAFVLNTNGVLGQALVRHSIFLENTVAIMLSAFHRVYSAQIDHVAMHANLYHKNGAMLKGDTGIDSDPIVGDPGFVGPLDELDRLGPALSKVLMLTKTSKARGRAIDGGDLGPFGRSKGADTDVDWQSIGPRVTAIYALPVGLAGKDRGVPGAKPTPGKRFGKRWWVLAGTGDHGEVDLLGTFGKSPKAGTSGWLSFAVEASKKGPAVLEVNGDIDTLELFVNKRSVATIEHNRRYGTAGLMVDVNLRTGSNSICVFVKSWGMRPRIGFAFGAGVRGVQAPDGEVGSLQIKNAKLVGKRGPRTIDVFVNQTLNWSDSGRSGLFEIRDAEGVKIDLPINIEASIVGSKKLRISGVPSNWKPPIQIILTGLRGPGGGVYGTTAAKMIR